MSSIRIIDTRFRILKGGKVGLAFSLALCGAVSVYGQDFFTSGSNYTTSTLTLSGNTVTTYANPSDANATFSTNGGSIVFKPAQSVYYSYDGLALINTNGTSDLSDDTNQSIGNMGLKVFADGIITSNFFGSYIDQTTIDANTTLYKHFSYVDPTIYTVNINADTNVSTISKEATTSTINRVPTSNYSGAYTANIVLDGNNTITGAVDISSDGNIYINGKVDFNGTVNSSTTNINTTQDVNFKENVTSRVNVNQASNVIFEKNLSSYLYTSFNSGANVIVDGNFTGNESFTDYYNTRNYYADIAAYGGTILIKGDTNANVYSSDSIVTLDNGLTSGAIQFGSGGQVIIKGGSTLNNVIGSNSYGTLTFDKNTTTTVYGNIGTRYAHNVGLTSTLDYYDYSSSSKIGEISLDSGDLIVDGELLASNSIKFNDGNATITLKGDLLTGSITTNINNTGAIYLTGTKNFYDKDRNVSNNGAYLEVEGDIGAADKKIATLDINSSDSTDITKITGKIYAVNTNVRSGNTIVLAGAGSSLHTSLNIDSNNTFDFISTGTGQTIENGLGTADKVFSILKLGDSNTSNSGITIDGDIYATNTKFYGTSTSLTELTITGQIYTNSITVDNNNSGILNYNSLTTLANSQIGTSDKMLAEVNFNTLGNNIHQIINYDIYAVDTSIGGTTGSTTLSLVDVTGNYDFVGASNIQEFRGGTSVNFDRNTTFGGNLWIENGTSAINIGTKTLTVNGRINTQNGGMSFTVNTKDITGADSATSEATGSGQIVSSGLNMSGSEKIRINYVGSLANAGTYILVDNGGSLSGNYDQNDTTSFVTDNSFSIDTRVHTVGNDLIVAADRTGGGDYAVKDLYVEKSATQGHFSNNAAKVIAGISGSGAQAGDMIEVIQKLELDSFGYGNTAEKLAVQVKKLAPIVNTSLTQTALSATNQITNTVGSRISDIRGLSSGDEVLNKAVWIKLISASGTQDKVGDYDGYTLKSSGAVFGFDKILDSGITAGVSAGYIKTDTDQTDFRTGDSASTTSYQFTGYGSKTFGKAYVDGSIAYATHSTSGNRATAIDREASYVADATQISAKVAAGYSFKYNNGVFLTPFASLDYSTVSQGAYTETGAGSIGLSVDSVSFARGSYGLGANVKKDVKLGNSIYTPEFNIGMNQYFGETQVDTVAQFAQGEKFTTEGSTMMKSMFNYGIGVSTKLSERTNISVNTDFKQSDNNFKSTDVQFAFRLMF